MERIRIAIVSDIPEAEKRGLTTAVSNLISYLKARGHEVRVICSDDAMLGQRGYIVLKPLPQEEKTGLIRNLFKKDAPMFSVPEQAQMKEALSGVDVVHIIAPLRLGTLALQTAQALQLPVTADFHFPLEELRQREKASAEPVVLDESYETLYERFYSHVRTIHYPTAYLRDLLESAVGRTRGKLIYNGVSARFKKVDAPRPESLKDRFVILYIARFIPEKNHTILIDAVRSSGLDRKIQLIFAGEGPLKEELEDYASVLHNPPVMNYFSRSDLLKVISWADLYVHPAEVDPESVACMEAACCGLVPVIANAQNSAARFFAVGSRNLFQYDDPLELASRIEYWMTHPEEKEKLSLRYQGFSKEFSLMSSMEKLEMMLYEASGRE